MLFITLFQVVLKAQRPNSFSYDPNVFITEFESFMRSGKSDAKDEADNFVANYNTGKFSLPQKQQMVKLCNEMLQKTNAAKCGVLLLHANCQCFGIA